MGSRQARNGNGVGNHLSSFRALPHSPHQLATGLPHDIRNYGSEIKGGYPVVGVLVEFALLLKVVYRNSMIQFRRIQARSATRDND